MQRRGVHGDVLLCIFYLPVAQAANTKGCEEILPGIILDTKIPNTVHTIIVVIKIAVPVLLVIFGMLDLFKGIIAQKEDEIKKGQQMFIKRLILGALIFFVIVIVKFAISLVADSSTSNIVECIDCFVDNDCKRQGLSGILDEAEDLKDGIIDGLNSVKDNIEQTVEK